MNCFLFQFRYYSYTKEGQANTFLTLTTDHTLHTITAFV